MPVFFKLFLPAERLMARIPYINKIILVLLIISVPLIYSSYSLYNDLQIRLSQSKDALKDVQRNDHIYQMVLALQELERDGSLYLRRNSALDIMEFENREKSTMKVHLELLKHLDMKEQEVYIGYYERINYALLHQDKADFIQQVYAYQHRLFKELTKLKLDYLSSTHFSVSDMAYLLSVELPFSSLVTTELKTLRTDKFEKKKLFIKIGELKASVNKIDHILHQFNNYKEDFDELSLKYQRSVQLYSKLLLREIPVEAETKEHQILQVQLAIFKKLKEMTSQLIVSEQKDLDDQYRTFLIILISMLCLGVYFLIGSYMNFSASLKSFLSTRTDILNGKLDARIHLRNQDEMGLLSHEFNEMIEELDYNHALFDEYQRAVGSSALIVKTDINGLITYVNKAFEKVSGYSKDELIGQTHSKMRSSATTYEMIEELWNTILANRVYKTTFENIAKNGKSFYVDTTIVPILDRKGKIQEFISIMLDITPMKKQKKTLQAQLYKDKLTSLPNRMKLIEDIEKSKNPKLIIINIDEFKEINSIFGEAIGDETLQKMAVAIKDALQTHYLQLYKLSGDEFAILADEDTNADAFMKDVTLLSNNLNGTKFQCGNHEVNIRLTIGAVLAEFHMSDKPLISMADVAMREAKRRSQPYLFYQDISHIEEDLEKNYKMAQVIARAIRDDKVRCCFQGIINAKTGRIDKYESLMRIEGENGEMLSPEQFITIAKRARYYPKLTQKIVQEAVFTFVNREESFTINLSIDDIMDDNTYNYILDIVKNCGCADRMVFEFLESEEIEFTERMMEFSSQIRKLGAKLAIDDFGSGYSNYAYLIKFGVDILKIDASLIKDIQTSEQSRLIIQSIIDIAHALGMETVAEHVHSKEISELVTSMGVDYLQGYYLHKPSNKI